MLLVLVLAGAVAGAAGAVGVQVLLALALVSQGVGAAPAWRICKVSPHIGVSLRVPTRISMHARREGVGPKDSTTSTTRY